MEQQPTLAIIVPCYNEQEVLESSDARLRGILGQMISDGLVAPDSFVMYVNDGSRDGTWHIIETLCNLYDNVAGLNLAGNVGHQRALMAGLVKGVEVCDISVSIDADLQDDIEVIPQMVREYLDGADIVYGVRSSRASDTWFKRTTAQGFYRLMQWLGVRTVYNHADFRLMSRRAMAQLARHGEANLFLRGIVPTLGYRQAQVTYSRKPRMAGESKYPLGKMINFAVDGITSFSTKPVRLIFWLGVAFMATAFAILLYVLAQYLKHDTVPGWSSVILSIWFCSSVLLISMGIMGEYIGKIYAEVKGRPRYNLERYMAPRVSRDGDSAV